MCGLGWHRHPPSLTDRHPQDSRNREALRQPGSDVTLMNDRLNAHTGPVRSASKTLKTGFLRAYKGRFHEYLNETWVVSTLGFFPPKKYEIYPDKL